jgi:hypothetical protein
MIHRPNVRQALFPYGMQRNPDGSWTFFNRNYKPVGVISDDYLEWDDPRHKMKLKGLGPAKLAKLDVHGQGTGDRIHFYNDGTNPENSAADMRAYLDKLKILLGVQDDW